MRLPAEAPAAETAAAPAANVEAAAPIADGFRVGRGQSLWSIAEEVLGSGKRYREILELNPSLRRNPNLIYPGQQLKLP